MTKEIGCGILYEPSGESTKQNLQGTVNLGVAQLGARYLGVVEAAGSSPVTQIDEIRYSSECLIFLLFYILYFHINKGGSHHGSLLL